MIDDEAGCRGSPDDAARQLPLSSIYPDVHTTTYSMTPPNPTLPGTESPSKASFWYDPKVRAVLYQVGALAMVGLLAYYLMTNTLANLERQSIATGFGFLDKQASFEIGEALIPYSAADSYARALVVGALNTLLVSFIGVAITIILGTFVGIARLSSNWLVSRLAGIYIEVFQDIPVLLQLFFWYAFFYEILPSPPPGHQSLPRSLSVQPGADLRHSGGRSRL